MAGILAVCTTAVCLLFSQKYIFILGAVIALLICCTVIFLRDRRYFKALLIALAVSLVFCIRFIVFLNLQVLPIAKLDGETVNARVEVCDVKQGDTSSLVTVMVRDNGEFSLKNFKTEFYINTDDRYSPGDVLSARLQYYPSQYYDDGVYISARARYVKKLSHKDTIYSLLYKLRTRINDAYFENMSYDEASLLSGLTLGQTDRMRESIYDSLRRCGLLHLTAVSGTHLSAFCYSIFLLLQKLKLNRRVSALLTLPFVPLIVLLAGFSASVIRAGIMFSIFLIGFVAVKKADPLNSLGIAAFLMIFFNPYYVNSISFILSFSAMLGFLIVMPKITEAVRVTAFKHKALNRAADYIISLGCGAVIAMLFTLPATVVIFGEFSLISPVLNIICGVPAMTAMLLGAVGVIFTPVLAVVRPIASFIITVTEFFGGFSFASVNATPEYVLPWLAATLMLVGALIILKKPRPIMCILMSAVLLCVSALSCSVINRDTVRVSVLNNGEGMSVVVSAGNSAAVIGLGGKYPVQNVADCFGRYSLKNAELLILPYDAKNCMPSGALDKLRFKKAIAPTDNAALNSRLSRVGIKTESLSDMTVKINKKIFFKTVAVHRGYVIQCEIEGKKGLIIFGSDMLPDGYTEPDFVITASPLPENISLKNDTAVIFAMADQDAYELMDVGNNYIADDSSVDLLIKNGKITARTIN